MGLKASDYLEAWGDFANHAGMAKNTENAVLG